MLIDVSKAQEVIKDLQEQLDERDEVIADYEIRFQAQDDLIHSLRVQLESVISARVDADVVDLVDADAVG